MLRGVPSDRSEESSAKASGSGDTRPRSVEDLLRTKSSADEVGLYLVSLGVRERGRWIKLSETPLSGGRDPNLDLVLDNGEISRLHVLVSVMNETVIVEDLGSTNGTFVDGRRVTTRASVPVGSVLRVGDRSFRCVRASQRDAERAEKEYDDLDRAANY